MVSRGAARPNPSAHLQNGGEGSARGGACGDGDCSAPVARRSGEVSMSDTVLIFGKDN